MWGAARVCECVCACVCGRVGGGREVRLSYGSIQKRRNGVNMCLETESIGTEIPDAVWLQAQLRQQQSKGGLMVVWGQEWWRGGHLIHSTQPLPACPTPSSLALAKVSTVAATFSSQ